VGFDLYVRLVGEAVAEFKGEASEQAADVRVELPVDAHLPHDYVPGERLRLEAYKKIAAAHTDDELAAVRDELRDRYGELPPPVDNLMAVASFRAHARKFGLTDVATQGKYIRFAPLELRESQTVRLQRLHPGSLVKPATGTVLVPAPTTARVGGQPVRDRALLDWARGLLDTVITDLAAVGAAAHPGE
jgi:transcription-repair coupling factor (superfamily II helicase)